MMPTGTKQAVNSESTPPAFLVVLWPQQRERMAKLFFAHLFDMDKSLVTADRTDLQVTELFFFKDFAAWVLSTT